MHFSHDEIMQLTTSIWEQMLRLPICADDTAVTVPHSGPRVMSACVQIIGTWQGAVSLTCTEDFASRAAGIMFGLDGVDTRKADMQDALGELANMIGGNIKALLPVACHL